MSFCHSFACLVLCLLNCREYFRYDAYFPIDENQWPIVYSPAYNIRFGGLENLHPFDSKKWGRVYEILEGVYFCGYILYIHCVLIDF